MTLGKKANGDTIPSIGVNTTVQQRNGMPLYSYWSRPYTYTDPNNDGMLTSLNVVVDTTWKPKGYSQPRDEISITNGFEFLNRRLRLTLMADYKGGSVLFNNEEGFLCQQSVSCPYISGWKTTKMPSLANQGRALAYRDMGTLNTAWGFMEPLQFWRLREVSAVYTIPDKYARQLFRAAGAQGPGVLGMNSRNIHFIARLNAAMRKALTTEKVRESFAKLGVDVGGQFGLGHQQEGGGEERECHGDLEVEYLASLLIDFVRLIFLP